MPRRTAMLLRGWARKHELEPKLVARAARKGQLPKECGAVKNERFNRWVIWTQADPAVVQAVLDTQGDGSTRTREDGRRRFYVYATSDERSKVAAIVGEEQVKDPRVLRKDRLARKAAAAAAEKAAAQ